MILKKTNFRRNRLILLNSSKGKLNNWKAVKKKKKNIIFNKNFLFTRPVGICNFKPCQDDDLPFDATFPHTVSFLTLGGVFTQCSLTLECYSHTTSLLGSSILNWALVITVISLDWSWKTNPYLIITLSLLIYC